MTDAAKNNEPKLLEPGVFKGRPTQGLLTESNNGRATYTVTFMLLTGPDSGKHVTWFGGLDGNSVKYTGEALMRLGWDGKQRLKDFRPTKEAQLVLEHHTIPAVAPTPSDPNGKPARKITRVKYINDLDGTGGPSMDKFKIKDDAKADAISDDFSAKFAATKNATGAPGSGDGTSNTFDTGTAADDDLPF